MDALCGIGGGDLFFPSHSDHVLDLGCVFVEE
jgi:hypothetical protein